MINKKLRSVLISFLLIGGLCACGMGEEELIIIGTGVNGDESVKEPESGNAELPVSSGQLPVDCESVTQDRVIYVYVCGAVINPGVYELPEGSRAEAALLLAGGFDQDAADSFVNLAAVLQDGEKLYFPTEQEVQQEAVFSETDGKVNINLASVEELCSLPGIGESRAADIVAYREKQGRFQSCEDIMKVSGIKQSVFQKIQDKIKVD